VSGAAPPAAIVLAAGASRRFGADNKLLVDIGGQPMIARVIAAIEAAGIADVVIVTGHEAQRVAAATAGQSRRHVHNPRHDEGMGTSVAAGIAALGPETTGVLIAQGDMPDVDAALIRALVDRFAAGGADAIVHPLLPDGRQGNPVIWPRRLFAALAGLEGDKGGKRLIEAEGPNAIGVADGSAAAGIDIDTPAARAAYRAARSSQP
jgi:molybdenum cofactor cytidylyltransferase